MSVRKSLIYFLIFVCVASYLAYKITDTAYTNAYSYELDYAYAIGTTNVYTPDPQH